LGVTVQQGDGVAGACEGMCGGQAGWACADDDEGPAAGRLLGWEGGLGLFAVAIGDEPFQVADGGGAVPVTAAATLFTGVMAEPPEDLRPGARLGGR